MSFSITEHIPANFSNSSRVWIYQSSRLFTMPEALELENILENFVTGWKSHGDPVTGYANLFFGQFIILMADETSTGVSGCSTDSSVHVIKEIEKKFSVNMFDRQSLAFLVKEKIQLLPLNQLNYAVENNFIYPDTIYFNNTVQTKTELLQKWMIPVKDSWLAVKLQLNKA